MILVKKTFEILFSSLFNDKEDKNLEETDII